MVIKQEVRRAVQSIEQEAIDLALGLAENMVKEKVDDKVQTELVDGYLNDIKSLDKAA